MKVFGYVRVSTETQSEEGYGIDTQKQAIKEYCKNNDLELLEIFCDEGISGAVNETRLELNRPGFNKLIESITDRQTVVVLNTSRLWRNHLAGVLIRNDLLIRESEVISIEQGNYSIRDKNPINNLMNDITVAIDCYERSNIMMKLEKGRITKARDGISASGAAPLGYKWGRKGKKSVIEVFPKKKKIVKEIFNKYLNLKSLEKVRRYVNDKGYTTAKEKEFSSMGIYKILSNPFYIGEVNWGGIKSKGQHEPIISKVIFGKVQALKDRNRRGEKRGVKV